MYYLIRETTTGRLTIWESEKDAPGCLHFKNRVWLDEKHEVKEKNTKRDPIYTTLAQIRSGSLAYQNSHFTFAAQSESLEDILTHAALEAL